MTPAPFGEIAEVSAILHHEDMRHALIGGWAVVSWGFSRTSDDVDLMAEIPASRRKRLLDALAPKYEATWIRGDIDDPVRGLIRARPKDPRGYPVDILAARGETDRAALGRAAPIKAAGTTVPIVLAEDLIAMKLESGGGKDFQDVRGLLEIRAGLLDEKLLAAACEERRVSDKLAMVRSRR